MIKVPQPSLLGQQGGKEEVYEGDRDFSVFHRVRASPWDYKQEQDNWKHAEDWRNGLSGLREENTEDDLKKESLVIGE